MNVPEHNCGDRVQSGHFGGDGLAVSAFCQGTRVQVGVTGNRAGHLGKRSQPRVRQEMEYG
jgi:hypothetical protein